VKNKFPKVPNGSQRFSKASNVKSTNDLEKILILNFKKSIGHNDPELEQKHFCFWFLCRQFYGTRFKTLLPLACSHDIT
jgi:hypothetical protein